MPVDPVSERKRQTTWEAGFELDWHEEQNHRGLENLLIDSGDEVGNTTGTIECGECLGGRLLYCHRRAA